MAVTVVFMLASPGSTGLGRRSGLPDLPPAGDFQPYFSSLIRKGTLKPDCVVYVVPGCSSCTLLPNPNDCGGAKHCYLILGDYPTSSLRTYKGKLIIDAEKKLLPRKAYQGPEFVVRLRNGKVHQIFRITLSKFADLEVGQS